MSEVSEREFHEVKQSVNTLQDGYTRLQADVAYVRSSIDNLSNALGRVSERLDRPAPGINWGAMLTAVLTGAALIVTLLAGYANMLVAPLKHIDADRARHVRMLDEDLNELERELSFLKGGLAARGMDHDGGVK